MKLSPAEKQAIFDQALKNNTAISLDWKFPVEDIVFNVSSLLPDLDIQSLPEKQILSDWVQTMVLEGNEYSFKADSPTLILDVIATINKHLGKEDRTFIFNDTQDDDFGFILISCDELPDYLEKGFLEI